MADNRKTQEEVDKSSQTASEQTSMTITMPPPPENFPQFSQNEANGMQTEENAVSGHLAKTPPQEFANFNKQFNANSSEADQSSKQLSRTGNVKKRQMGTKSSTDTHGNKVKVRELTEKKNGMKKKKGRKSPFQMYQHCSTKDVDNDNIETDDEDGDDHEPSESLCERILRFGFKRRKDEKVNEPEVLEVYESSASGNIFGAESNSRDPAATTHLKDANSNNAREPERLGEGPEETHNGAIIPDPNFNTEVLYSEERAPEIIKAEPVGRNIAIIHKMVEKPPKEPETSTLKWIRQKASSWAGRLDRPGRYSQSGKDNEARMSLRHNEADLGALTRDESRCNAERGVVNDHTNSTKDHEKQTNRTTNKSGTMDSAHNVKQTGSSGQNSEEMILDANANGPKELETQVIQMTNRIDSVRICFISKSKSVKSVEPIIEDASNETRGENAVPESAQRLRPTWEPIYSGPEGTTLKRQPRVERLRRAFTGSIDEVINSNATPYLMPNVDIQGSSALNGFLGNIATNNFISFNSGLIQSQANPALLTGVDDADFGTPLCRHSSREPSAEERRSTESGMNVNQQNDHETSTTVASAPEELQEYRILENYISAIAVTKKKCYPEVHRNCRALERCIKMDTIQESDLEDDSEASQRSNSDPPSLTDTTNSSESSTSVQQQSSGWVSRSNAIRRKR